MSSVRALLWWPLNAIQGLYTALWTAGWICVALVISGLFRRKEIGLWLARNVWAPGLLWGAGARLEVSGLEHVDWNRVYLLAANHQSWIDIPALFRAVPVPLRFVAKQELARVPFLGAFIRAMGMVFVERTSGRKAARGIEQARQVLGERGWLVSFPEGTRSREGRVGRFRAGTFAAAIEAGVEVVPVAIEGAGQVLPAGGFRVRPGKIEVRFGEPIPVSGLSVRDREALARRAEAAVRDSLAGLRGEVPAPARIASPSLRNPIEKGERA